jgi:acetolactate synthase-1/2/3 large subunit
VQALEGLGAEVAFGMPGMWSLPIYDALSASGIRHVLVRHEQNAAYAADGYSRASGKFGLCVGTSGPGAVNIAAGLAAPFRDHSAVIALTGQVPSDEIGRGMIEDMDLQSLFRPVTKSTAQISEPSSAYDTIAEAYRTSLEGCPGPSHISIPGEIQKRPSQMKGYVPVLSMPEPDPASVDQSVELIASSRAPLILSGWGAVLSGAGEGISRLAEFTSAPVATSYMGRGIVPEDSPFALGPAGRRGTGAANTALNSCDLLIALGCRLSDLTIDRAKLTSKVIQVDLEPTNFSRLASLRVRSDVSLFLDAVLPRLKIQKRGATWAEKGATARGAESHAIEMARAITSYSDSIFAVDIGLHTVWTLGSLTANSPRSILFSGNLSAMGFSLPAAMGAKMAKPDRRVIAVTGDGGFQMNAPELSTMKENGIAVAVCVFNNRTLGMIRQLQERIYGRTFGVDYTDPPDYVKLAEAHGVRALKAGSPSDITDALRIVDEPIVIEIPVAKDEGIPLLNPKVLDYK